MDTIRKHMTLAGAFSSVVARFLLRNTRESQTVAKNTIWLSISNFGGRLLKAAVIIYAARVLGPAGWGIVSYAITLAGFFTFFADPGVNMTLMREGAKADDAGKTALLSTAFYIKLVLIAIVGAFVLFVAPLFSTLPGAGLLLPAAAIIIVGDTLREFFSSFIRAHEKMEREAVVFLLTNLAIVLLGFAFLLTVRTPASFAWAYAAGTTIGALLAIAMIWRSAGKFFSSFSLELVLPIIKAAWPFAAVGALGLLLTNTDILILSWFKNASDVGVYSAAIRIIQVFYLFPMIIQYSILPLFSRLAGKDDGRLRMLLERAVVAVCAVSIPVALVGVILGMSIMGFVFGSAYAAGGLSLSILMITMVFDYPGGILGVAVFSYDRQKQLIYASLIGGITNVLFDLILIPRFGITGSAIATLIAQILTNAYLWHAMKRINYFTVMPRLKKITAAALLSALASAFLLGVGAPFIPIILGSVIVYFGALIAFGEPLIGEFGRLFSGARIEELATSALERASIEIGGIPLSVEIARDEASIKKGLSERDVLPAGSGMLFAFEEAKQYRFWMARMRFPLDIIWIDDGVVVDITENASEIVDPDAPLFYEPKKPARSVLEVNAGFCAERGIAIGSRFVFASAPVRKVVMVRAAHESKQEWNAFIESHFPPVGAFMETWEWGEFQKKLGRRAERFVVEDGAGEIIAVFTLVRFRLPCGLSYGYAPRGPVIARAESDPERVEIVLNAIKTWAQANLSDLIFLRLEPPVSSLPETLGRGDFCIPRFYLQPRHNALVALPQDEEKIAATFHSSTRSNLHRAEKRGVTAVMKTEIALEEYAGFARMVQDTIKRNSGTNAYPAETYFKAFLETIPFIKEPRDPAELSMAAFCGYRDGELASMHFVLFFGETATYLYGASRTDHLNSKVDTYLHWSAMKEAVRRGCRFYDLGGVDPKRWPSLTTFKSQFHGTVLDYAGNVDIPLKKQWYLAYRMLKRIGM